MEALRRLRARLACSLDYLVVSLVATLDLFPVTWEGLIE